MDDDTDFERFVRRVEPGLRRALSGHLAADDVADGVAEALTYAWEHRDRLLGLANPGGYLYRVAQSRSRRRKQGWLAWPRDRELPEFEPGLAAALASLAPQQFHAVWLVHACEWSHAEAAEALGVTPSTVSTHVARGMERLRAQLGEVVDG